MSKVAQFEQHAKERRKPLNLKGEKEFEEFFKVKPIQEGEVWVVKAKSRELRNRNRKEVLKDLATILGYDNG